MCNHVWQGNATGVTCKKCGKTLTAQEYAALTARPRPAATDKPETQARKRKPKTDK